MCIRDRCVAVAGTDSGDRCHLSQTQQADGLRASKKRKKKKKKKLKEEKFLAILKTALSVRHKKIIISLIRILVNY